MSQNGRTVVFSNNGRAYDVSEPPPAYDEVEMKPRRLDRGLTTFKNDGLEKIMQSKTTCGRAFWITLLLAAISVATYEIYKTVGDYNENPAITSYKIVAKEEMDFPQIYLCPSLNIKKSYLLKNRKKVERALELKSLMFDLTDVLNLFNKDNSTDNSTLSDNSTISGNGTSRPKRDVFLEQEDDWYERNKRDNASNHHGNDTKINLLRLQVNETHNVSFTPTMTPPTTTTPPPVYDNDTSEYLNQTMMAMGAEQGDLFLACQFRGFFTQLVPCKNITRAVLDPENNKCFLLDVGDLKQGVPAQGLTIILNLKTQEYPDEPEYAPKFDGLRISIAKQYDLSGYEQLFVPTNTYSKVDIFSTHSKFMNIPKMNQLCVDKDDDAAQFTFLDATYSKTSCEMECALGLVADRCNCLLTVDKIFLKYPNITAQYPFCNLGQVEDCVISNVTNSTDALQELKECAVQCEMACESWDYTARVTSMNLNKVAFPKYPPNTTLYDFMYIQFSFPNLEYEEFTQDWSMSIDDMIGTLGSHIGLWLGASILATLQLWIMLISFAGYHAYHHTSAAVRRVSRRFTQPQVST